MPEEKVCVTDLAIEAYRKYDKETALSYIPELVNVITQLQDRIDGLERNQQSIFESLNSGNGSYKP